MQCNVADYNLGTILHYYISERAKFGHTRSFFETKLNFQNFRTHCATNFFFEFDIDIDDSPCMSPFSLKYFLICTFEII
jgi:hypothetical protein